MPVSHQKKKSPPVSHQKDSKKPSFAPNSPGAPAAGPAAEPFARWLPLVAIHPYFSNPRVNEAAVEGVARSIKTFGFKVPIVVDEDMTIIMGHTRRLAAMSLGMTSVLVHVAKDLTPEQARALRLVDNKVAERSEWDEDLLRVEGMAIMESGIDLTKFGFDLSEFETHISKLPKDNYLEDFSVVPKPKPQWILISCDYETAAEIMEDVRHRPGVVAHCTAQQNSKLALKNLGKAKHKG